MNELDAKYESSTDMRTAQVAWFALGALVVGSVGAAMSARRCVRRGSRHERWTPAHDAEPAAFTAPHGDKLSRALEG